MKMHSSIRRGGLAGVCAVLALAAPAADARLPASDSEALAQVRPDPFEGGWALEGQAHATILIKSFASHLVVHGLDSASAWTARCSRLDDRTLKCQGSVHMNSGIGDYQSTIRIVEDEPAVLLDEWSVCCQEGGAALVGQDRLRRVTPATPLPREAITPTR